MQFLKVSENKGYFKGAWEIGKHEEHGKVRGRLRTIVV